MKSGCSDVKKFLHHIPFGILLLIQIMGCAMPDSDTFTSGFGETSDSDDSTSWFKFYSNDPADYQRAFSYLLDDSHQDVFTGAEIFVKKNSGYMYSDYGMVFCASEGSYLALVIDTQKYYRVFKSANGTVTPLIDWTASDALFAGYGTQNSLRVKQSSAGHFDIYLNNANVNSFDESELASGSHGFFVYVASENYENLGENPVEVVYANK